MAFDDSKVQPSKKSQTTGLKQGAVATPSSINSAPKKPSQEQFNQQVKQVVDQNNSYKQQATELALAFDKAMNDRTLRQNKNIFAQESETDILREMIKLAQNVNEDPNERESEGSLSLIIMLLKNCFQQRDRLNHMDYANSVLKKEIADLRSELDGLKIKD